MKVIWADTAQDDLKRLFDFLAASNRAAAFRAIDALLEAPNRLLPFPRLGARLDQFSPREVRHIYVGRYDMRYEILPDEIWIIEIWHVKEDR